MLEDIGGSVGGWVDVWRRGIHIAQDRPVLEDVFSSLSSSLSWVGG